MTLEQKINKSEHDSVSNAVMDSVRGAVYLRDTSVSVYESICYSVTDPISTTVDNKLKTYDFTTKNK